MSGLPVAPPLPAAFRSLIEIKQPTEDSNVCWQDQCDEDLERLIELEQRLNSRSPELIYKHFQPVFPIAQDGPTCGMVALSMGLSVVKLKKSPQDLIEMAQSSGWTTKGEMFSCEWMASLTRLAGAKAFVIKSGIRNHLGCFFSCIKQGGAILVPYDKDKNHAPHLGGGESAHWALVTGLICLGTSTAMNITGSTPCFMSDTASTHCSTNWEIADDIEWRDANYKDGIGIPYVAAYQGRAKRVNLWPFTKLAESNDNLSTVGERHSWVHLPPDGIVGGLLGQAVLILPY